jgi:hypothetical protein
MRIDLYFAVDIDKTNTQPIRLGAGSWGISLPFSLEIFFYEWLAVINILVGLSSQ